MAKKNILSKYSSEFPRPGSRVYNRMLADERTRKKILNERNDITNTSSFPFTRYDYYHSLELEDLGFSYSIRVEKPVKKELHLLVITVAMV